MKKKKIFAKLALSALLAVSAIPVSFASAATGYYLGSWDLKGTGQQQSVYNQLSQIAVVEPSGTSRTYSIGNTSWALLGVEDLDGEPGAEIILNVVKPGTIGGSVVYIISHRTGQVRSYDPGGSWAVLKTTDTDGEPGKEIVLKVIPRSFGVEEIKIINQRRQEVKRYAFNESIAPLGFADTDGQPGEEVIINRAGNAVVFIRDRTTNLTVSTLRTTNWNVLGISDTDGKPGQEVVLNTGQHVYTIRDASRTAGNHAIGTYWTFRGFANMDGRPGNEIQVLVNGVLKIVYDNTDSSVIR
ncbi:hypothetical protein ACFQZE_19975 [Paenibacillus sp. GCM10027627]|uniref:hypothetical protein n=1 Tax=unclassified Paenibacillus TaxID=185978 RepID=UPI003632F14F